MLHILQYNRKNIQRCFSSQYNNCWYGLNGKYIGDNTCVKNIVSNMLLSISHDYDGNKFTTSYKIKYKIINHNELLDNIQKEIHIQKQSNSHYNCINNLININGIKTHNTQNGTIVRIPYKNIINNNEISFYMNRTFWKYTRQELNCKITPEIINQQITFPIRHAYLSYGILFEELTIYKLYRPFTTKSHSISIHNIDNIHNIEDVYFTHHIDDTDKNVK